MDKDPDNTKGFKVEDKRRFTAEGEAKEAETPKSKTPENVQGAKEPREFPPLDFTTFVLSLASSVQVHLGLIPNPGTGKTEKSLTLAKQTIDLLGLLQEKTKGNLTEDENKVLEGVLYNLRLQFVEAKK